MISFAHRFKRLKLFLHLSTGNYGCHSDRNIKAHSTLGSIYDISTCCVCCQTAYLNGQRRGVVLEEPLYLGETIASRIGSSSDFSEHKNAVLDIEAEIKLAFDFRRQFKNSSSFYKEMKDLGIHRYI